ncbi:unnamed protein product, partial [Ceratitis capitata]
RSVSLSQPRCGMITQKFQFSMPLSSQADQMESSIFYLHRLLSVSLRRRRLRCHCLRCQFVYTFGFNSVDVVVNSAADVASVAVVNLLPLYRQFKSIAVCLLLLLLLLLFLLLFCTPVVPVVVFYSSTALLLLIAARCLLLLLATDSGETGNSLRGPSCHRRLLLVASKA